MGKCISLMKAHFEDVVSTDIFIRLPAETVFTLLRSEDLSVASEEHVIEAIARWVHAGDEAGDDGRLNVHAPSMLKEVQWHRTTVQCRNRLMESHQLFKRSPECLLLMFQIVNWISAADNERPPCPFNLRRLQTVFFLFGDDKDRKDMWSVLRVDPHLQKVERVANMKSDRRWHKLPDMPEARWGPAAACLPGDRRVFVFGGQDDSSPVLASVIFCHLRADWREKAITVDFWISAAPMRTARRGLAAAPFRRAILVAGVYDGRKTLNAVEMFSPPEARCPLGQWTELAGTKQSRSWFALLTSTDTVFALGDEDGFQNTVEALASTGGSAEFDSDLTSWSWSSKNPVETLCRVCGAASIRV
ncbi:Kelch-like protein 6 [Sparganum proliferum]